MLADNGLAYIAVKSQQFAAHKILNKISISKKQAVLVVFLKRLVAVVKMSSKKSA